jgi:hypothetical protein
VNRNDSGHQPHREEPVPAESAPESAFAALTAEKRARLLRDVFDVLEYGPDGTAAEWSSDTLQALGDLFSQLGIVFTSPA